MTKILIVEDDKITLEIMDVILKKNGFETVLAKNGKEAIEIFGNEHIDAVILDIIMPEMDGISAAKIIHRKKPSVPLIAVTACEHNEARLHNGDISNLNMTYVHKPFQLNHLLDTVRMKLHP